MSVANISVVQNPAEAKAGLLGLSNGLFCNSGGYAAKITPNSIVTRRIAPPRKEAPVGLDKAREKVKAEGYNGKMSKRTRASVTGMLAEWFTAKKAELGKAFTTLNAAARLFTFCTLTLCAQQFHTDNHIKRHGLGRFLQECKREYGIATYFWRAEPQANGNIHFHILFAQAIPWQWIRSTWNDILKDLGYIKLYSDKMQYRYREGFKPASQAYDKRPIEQQVKAYREGEACGWTNPNSTDIHRLNKTRNAAAYVCKYVSKDSSSRKIDGRIWGCSDDIRQLETPEIGITEDFMRGLRLAAHQGDIRLHQCEHVAIYSGNIVGLLSTAAPELIAALEGYYVEVSRWLAKLHSGATPHPKI